MAEYLSFLAWLLDIPVVLDVVLSIGNRAKQNTKKKYLTHALTPLACMCYNYTHTHTHTYTHIHSTMHTFSQSLARTLFIHLYIKLTECLVCTVSVMLWVDDSKTSDNTHRYTGLNAWTYSHRGTSPSHILIRINRLKTTLFPHSVSIPSLIHKSSALFSS